MASFYKCHSFFNGRIFKKTEFNKQTDHGFVIVFGSSKRLYKISSSYRYFISRNLYIIRKNRARDQASSMKWTFFGRQTDKQTGFRLKDLIRNLMQIYIFGVKEYTKFHHYNLSLVVLFSFKIHTHRQTGSRLINCLNQNWVQNYIIGVRAIYQISPI